MISRLLFFLLCLLWSSRLLAQSERDAQLADSLLRVALQLLEQQDSVFKASFDTNRASINPTSSRGFTITGKVLDQHTQEGIPFATVFFPGTGVGTASDLDGNFELKVENLPVDTLYFQSIGYAVFQQPLNRQAGQQAFSIELIRAASSLDEFVFYAGEDPAITLLKKIIRRKPQNNYDELPAYRYEAYNKLEVDLVNLSKKQFESLPIPMIKKFSFIYNNLDSSGVPPFLPFFLTETISDYYYQRSPQKAREFIRANQLKGISNENFTQYLGAMQQQLNVYDNYILVLNKNFISPVADNAPFYYRYKIVDTQQVYGMEAYQVSFHPRRTGENCFYGDFWVVDSSYALQRITMELPKEANINFVNKASLYQEFMPLNDSVWFLVKDKFISDFTLPYGALLPGFIGRKTTTYRDIHINDSTTLAVLHDETIKEHVVVAEDARHKDESFWQTRRHDTLSKNEKAIYGMIDTLESMPGFKRFKKTMKFLVTGKLEAGPVEFGPYFYLYSRNPVEGNRFRFTAGTTPKLFKDIKLNGYLAYGDKDQEFKYQLSALWILNRLPRTQLFAAHTHDIIRKPDSDAPVNDENIFSRLVRKPGIPYKLAMEDFSSVSYFKEYFSGFSHEIYAEYKRFQPYYPLPAQGIFFSKDGRPADHVTSNEAGIRLRYAWREKFIEGNYRRRSLGSRYPIVELTGSAGFKGILNGGYAYQRLGLAVHNKARVANLGKLEYAVFAGRIFGVLPYPLLEAHRGNEYYYYSKSAFSMMNDYEFISDEWAGFFLEHNFNGVFNYIPLLQKAGLRQVWTAKGIIGSLSPANQALNLNKGFPFRTLAGNPYLELGTGISNILELFRLDFVWRVSPNPSPNERMEDRFGVFGSIRLDF